MPIHFNMPRLLSLDSNSTEDESADPQVSMEMKEQFMPPQGEAINSQPTGKNILSVFPPFSNIQFLASMTFPHLATKHNNVFFPITVYSNNGNAFQNHSLQDKLKL